MQSREKQSQNVNSIFTSPPTLIIETTECDATTTVKSSENTQDSFVSTEVTDSCKKTPKGGVTLEIPDIDWEQIHQEKVKHEKLNSDQRKQHTINKQKMEKRMKISKSTETAISRLQQLLPCKNSPNHYDIIDEELEE